MQKAEHDKISAEEDGDSDATDNLPAVPAFPFAPAAPTTVPLRLDLLGRLRRHGRGKLGVAVSRGLLGVSDSP